jgi:N-acetylglucosamine kinase-like BadF-type ATPase
VRALENSAEDDGRSGSELGRKVIRPMWTALADEMMAKLDSVSIDDLCSKAYHSGIASEVAQKMDFTI